MTYAGEHIIAALKAARIEKGLSQRELSQRAGVPQSHISRIETGAVDLQLSSLIDLTRVLDLELMPVPRRLVPAVQGVVRSAASTATHQSEIARQILKYLKRIRKSANRLQGVPATEKERLDLLRIAGELELLRPGAAELASIRRISDAVQEIEPGPGAEQKLGDAARELRRVRNEHVHNASAGQPVPAAYTLDEDEDA